jgi:hypothetical protein
MPYQAGGPVYGDTLRDHVELVGRAYGVLGQVLVELARGACSSKDDFLNGSFYSGYIFSLKHY